MYVGFGTILSFRDIHWGSWNVTWRIRQGLPRYVHRSAQDLLQFHPLGCEHLKGDTLKDPFLSQWASHHLHKLTSDSPWRVLGCVPGEDFLRGHPSGDWGAVGLGQGRGGSVFLTRSPSDSYAQ